MTHTSHWSRRQRKIKVPPEIKISEQKEPTGVPTINPSGKRFVFGLDKGAIDRDHKVPRRRVSKKKVTLERLGVPASRWWRI